MSKAFIARVIQQSTEVTAAAAHRATKDLVEAIVKEMKKSGKFTPAQLRYLHRPEDQGSQGA